MSSKRIWILAAILGGTLLTGVGIGSVTTLVLLKPMRLVDPPPPPPPPPDLASVQMRKPPVADFMLEHMDRELSLNAEQRTAIAEELYQTSRMFDELHSATGNEIQEILQRADLAIKSHLTEAQRAIFDETFTKRRFGNRFQGERGQGWRHRDERMMEALEPLLQKKRPPARSAREAHDARGCSRDRVSSFPCLRVCWPQSTASCRADGHRLLQSGERRHERASP